MRTLLVLAALVVAIRLSTYLPELPTATGLQPPYVQASQQVSLSSLLVGFCLGVMPVVGIFCLFRSFNRWHRAFHASMKASGITGRGPRQRR